MPEDTQTKSIYRQAADSGLWFGAYLLIMSVAFMCSLRVPQTSLLIIPLAAGIPCILWRFLRKVRRQQGERCSISALWMAGICLFIFGSLVCAFGSSIYMLAVEPDFINAYVRNALHTITSSPMASEYSMQTQAMYRALESHALPTGMQFIITMAWFTSFAGSLLSLVMAPIVQTYSAKTERKIDI